jgi:hypothetical protein
MRRGEDRSKTIDEHSEHLLWFSNQLGPVRQLFSNYICI